VTNPLSRDHSVLRRNLLGSLLDVLGTNLRHGREDVAVFEIGQGYGAVAGEPREWWRLGFALVGAAEPPAWNRPARPYDLDDAKGVVELLARRLHLGRPGYRPESGEPVLHPGRTARATIPGRLHALLGELQPATAEAWELRTTHRVIVAEVALEGLASGRLAPERAPAVGRHPEVERDLAIVVAEEVAAAMVEDAIATHGGPSARGPPVRHPSRRPLGSGEKSSRSDPVRRRADRGEGRTPGAIVAALLVGGRPAPEITPTIDSAPAHRHER
jgi:phenylalanyl-tRNA synthetase beta chain